MRSTRRTSASPNSSRVTRPRGSRCTPSTAARTCSRPTRRRSSARWRCARCRSMRPTRPRSPRALGLDRRARRARLPARHRQAHARAGRGFPHRFRGRLRQPARPRKRIARRSRGGRGRGRRCATARCRRRIGIRIKPLNEELKRRSLRTFDLFLTRLVDRGRRRAAARTSSSRCPRSPRPSRSRRSPPRATPSRTGASCRRARCASS